MKFRFLFVCLVFSFISQFMFSQDIPRKVPKGEEYWRYIIKARDAFDSGDLGEALLLAEKTNEMKRKESLWQTYVLENSFKKPRIRRFGDNIDLVLKELKAYADDDALYDTLSNAIEIINYHLEYHGEKYFNNSYFELIDFVKNYYSHCPEADYLLANIYSLEGEFEIAEEYYINAWKHSDILDVPAQRFDILYELAALSKNLGKDYEQHLLTIIKEDKNFSRESFKRAILYLINKDDPESVEKFFLLYRYDLASYENEVVLDAYIQLSDFYRLNSEIEKAKICAALACIISVSKLENALKDRGAEYKYTDFPSFLVKCSENAEIVQWGNDVRAWELFVNFADICSSSGQVLFARRLLTILSLYEPEVYWRSIAEHKLIN